MLYQCPQDSRVISMDTRKYFQLSDSDLTYYCTCGEGSTIGDPFYGSHAEARGVDLTRRQEEIEEDQEYEEEDDMINVDLNLPPDHFQ